MKILHLLWNFTTGGVQALLIDLANELASTEHVSIIAIDGNEDRKLVSLLDPRIEFVSLKRHSGSRNPLVVARLNFEIWRRNPDVIHVHMKGIAKFVYTTTPMVATIHNAFEKNVSKEYSKYKQIFSISEGVRQYTLKENKHDSIVIYNGVHSEQISSRSDGKLNKDGKIHFVEVGRLTKIKGQHLVIEALNILVNKLGYNKIHMDFIGDGDFRAELETHIAAYDLTNYVTLLGMRGKGYFYPRLCNYDCYIQPSLSEGFGITIAEAMCANIPVITSDQEGPLEVIDGGKLGISFKTGSVDDLVDKLVSFISGSISVDTNRALSYVRSNFDIKRSAQKYLEEYKKVVL